MLLVALHVHLAVLALLRLPQDVPIATDVLVDFLLVQRGSLCVRLVIQVVILILMALLSVLIALVEVPKVHPDKLVVFHVLRDFSVLVVVKVVAMHARLVVFRTLRAL